MFCCPDELSSFEGIGGELRETLDPSEMRVLIPSRRRIASTYIAYTRKAARTD